MNDHPSLENSNHPITPSPYLNDLLKKTYSNDKYIYIIASPTNHKCTYHLSLGEHKARVIIYNGNVLAFDANIYYDNIDEHLFT